MTTFENFDDFVAAVAARLEQGRREYSDVSFHRPPVELVDEVAQECLDLAGWGFVLWCRVRDLKKRVESSEVRNS